jgi:monoamine oxidase
MARTPLLRSILDMARDHRRAEARGVPVEAIVEERALAVSRRRFLVGVGTAAAALSLPGPKLAHGAQQPKIAIVGAGISGLTTALTLADAGVASTVYEASARIGGRMFSSSSYFDQGQVSEWCGELIDSGHKTVRTLAKRFHLPLADLLGAEPNGSEDTYYFDGQYYPKAQANIDFKPVHNALSGDVQGASYPTTYALSTATGQALDAMSVYDWIESRVAGGHASPMGQLLDVAYAIEYGADTTDQSALNLVYLLGYGASPGSFSIFGASDERSHIIGGNQLLPQAIADHLGVGPVVRTGMRMLAIAMNADGTYALTFSTPGSTTVVTADIVVLTLPFAVLRNFNYASAGFDALKDQAIQQLGRGRNGKIQLQFTSRLWNQTGAWPGISNGASYSDTGYQCAWDVTRGQAGSAGILVGYSGGSPTLATNANTAFSTATSNKVQADASTFLTRIEPVFPGLTSAWNGKATSSLPHLDSNMLCSYSYFRKGQYTSFGGYEKVRQGNVFFAGEHTSQDFQGFMEGGASEGVRAANEVLTSLGKK